MVKDPICGKEVDTLRARAVGIFGGVTYYFCSADCKSKFTDPRQSGGSAPPMLERRRSEPSTAATLAAAAAASSAADKDDGGGGSVRYAHSRIRRITGEVGTPVVQIDLSPNSAKRKAVPSEQLPSPTEEALEPARASRSWVWVALVMLIIAGAVLFFTLKR
jgi:YHS domain-containing protein